MRLKLGIHVHQPIPVTALFINAQIPGDAINQEENLDFGSQLCRLLYTAESLLHQILG